jgi:hypothetical protein
MWMLRMSGCLTVGEYEGATEAGTDEHRYCEPAKPVFQHGMGPFIDTDCQVERHT